MGFRGSVSSFVQRRPHTGSGLGAAGGAVAGVWGRRGGGLDVGPGGPALPSPSPHLVSMSPAFASHPQTEALGVGADGLGEHLGSQELAVAGGERLARRVEPEEGAQEQTCCSGKTLQGPAVRSCSEEAQGKPSPPLRPGLRGWGGEGTLSCLSWAQGGTGSGPPQVRGLSGNPPAPSCPPQS